MAPVLRKLGDGPAFPSASLAPAENEEDKMCRWLNLHLAAYTASVPGQTAVDSDYRVSNLGADLADGKALAIVLHQIAPDGTTDLERLLAIDDAEQRAAQVVSHSTHAPLLAQPDPRHICSPSTARVRACLAQLLHDARAIGAEFELDACDVSAGNQRLLFCQVAAMMTSFWGSRGLSSERGSAAADDDSPAKREEVALRNWMASLGLGRSIPSVDEACRDGTVLLTMAERLKPGCVEWKRVSTRRMSVDQLVKQSKCPGLSAGCASHHCMREFLAEGSQTDAAHSEPLASPTG